MGHENASEVLNFDAPRMSIQEIHEAFLAVGCDAVETNSFNGSRQDLEEANLQDRAEEVKPNCGPDRTASLRPASKTPGPSAIRHRLRRSKRAPASSASAWTNWETLYESFVPQMARG